MNCTVDFNSQLLLFKLEIANFRFHLRHNLNWYRLVMVMATTKIKKLWGTYDGCFKSFHWVRIFSFLAAPGLVAVDWHFTFASLLVWKSNTFV